MTIDTPPPGETCETAYDVSSSSFPDGPTGLGLVSPEGLAFDDHGNLYVASSATNRVRRYNASGVLTGIVAAGFTDPNTVVASLFPLSSLNHPHGLAFGPDLTADGEPELFVTSRGSSEVLVFDVVAPTFHSAFATADWTFS